MKKLKLYCILLASLSAISAQSCFNGCKEFLEYIAACACCDHEYISSASKNQKTAQANLNAIIQNAQQAQQIRAYTVAQRYNITPEETAVTPVETARSLNDRDNGSSDNSNISITTWAGSELNSFDLLELSNNSLASTQNSSNCSGFNCPNNSLNNSFYTSNTFYEESNRDANQSLGSNPSMIAAHNRPRSEPNSWENSPANSRSNSGNNSPKDLSLTARFHEKTKRAATASQCSDESSTQSTLAEPSNLAVYTMPHYSHEEMN